MASRNWQFLIERESIRARIQERVCQLSWRMVGQNPPTLQSSEYADSDPVAGAAQEDCFEGA